MAGGVERAKRPPSRFEYDFFFTKNVKRHPTVFVNCCVFAFIDILLTIVAFLYEQRFIGVSVINLCPTVVRCES